MFGFISDAIGGIAGALFGTHDNRQNRKESSKQNENNRQHNLEMWEKQKEWLSGEGNIHNQLDKISGGKYKEHMEKWAYMGPEERGKASRAEMEAAYPELNPWEMAGTSGASGLGGAMASDAGGQASSNTQAQQQQEAQAAQQQQQIQAQLMQTEMQTDTQTRNVHSQIQGDLVKTVLNNMQDSRKAKLTTDTSVETTSMSMQPQMEKLDHEIKNLGATYDQIASNTKLTEAQRAESITRETVAKAQELNIKVDSDLKRKMMSKIESEIKNNTYSQSVVGKIFSDVFNRGQQGIKHAGKSMDKIAENSAESTAGSDLDLLRYIIGSDKVSESKAGVSGATNHSKYRSPPQISGTQ